MTKELRSILKDMMYQEIENIQDNLDQLNPKERLELLIKLMPFVLPKTTSISHTSNEPLDFEFWTWRRYACYWTVIVPYIALWGEHW